jgi:peptidoglycan/LPS O-acetylase OafA/YrhL
MFILDRSKNDTSVTLDLLRAIAAQMVCVGHGIAFFMPPWRPSELPLMQNVGVLIFFVLSGLLISFTLIERSKHSSYGFGTFWLERFARIYSALVPALLFVAVLDGVVIHIFNERAFADYYTAKTFVGNLFMFESYRGVLAKYLRTPAFGSASPLWTLAIEWHIYMFVAAVFFIWARPRRRLLMIALAILFCQVPLHYLRGSQSADGVGMGLFSLWLMGTCVLLVLRKVQLPYWASLLLALGAAICFFLVTKAGKEYNVLTYATLVVFLFGVLAASQSQRLITSNPVIGSVKFFADYSFTLYLVHYSIMFAAFVIRPERNFYIFAIMVLVANIVAIAIAVPTEMRHREFARFLKNTAEKYLGRYRLQKK